MLFNSLEFAFFFAVVYGLYLLFDHKWQNRMLLVASCVFYGAWNWKLLFLIFVSITLDYFLGIFIHRAENPRKRKLLLWLSVAGNLSILGFFKYFNFFAENFHSLLHAFGIPVSLPALHIILPVGISFYTFQSLSYTIDIYRKELKPERDFFNFALFVMFFPQLVAGPIERAKHLLPQIQSPRVIRLDWFYEGIYLIVWGLWEKIFVADNLAKIVDPVFSSTPPYNLWEVLLAVYAFSFQILCDFDGYSNVARGLGRVMGFDIVENFRFPYFSTNPQALWKGWHISLTTWLKDYLYVPLTKIGKRSSLKAYGSIFITMTLCGLWHGAAWNCVLFGAYHGIVLVVYHLLKPFLRKVPEIKAPVLNKIMVGICMVFNFHVWSLGFITFRSQSMPQLFEMIRGLFSGFSGFLGIADRFLSMAYFVFFLLLVQAFQYSRNNLLVMRYWPRVYRVAFFLVLGFLTLYVIILGKAAGISGGKEYIYFQF